MTIRCAGCAKDMDATASLCVACRLTMEISLANISSYHHELETMRARLARFGTGGSGRSNGEARLGMDIRFTPTGRATAVESHVRSVVVGWTRYVLDHVPPVYGPTCDVSCLHTSCRTVRMTAHPRDTIASCCAYLLRFSDWLRVSPVGGDVLTDTTAIERRLRVLIDRPADQWYAGLCGSVTSTPSGDVVCERELWAQDNAVFVRCNDCGCTYDVPARRAALLVEAEDRVATIAMIARVVTTLGDTSASRDTIAARIRQWATRGRITSHGLRVVDGRPRPLYRIGDVLDILAREATRTRNRAS